MKTLQTLLAGLLRLLWGGWYTALRDLWVSLCALWSNWRAQQALPGRSRKASNAPCEPIDKPAMKRPDPLIYSQYDLLARGFAVTWNNPDIELRQGGVPVPAGSLLPDTDYEIVARIWNSSPDAPVVGLPVIFSFMSFGIGVKFDVIGALSVNLGVKGGPGHPAFATMPWRTPKVAGHYCLLVLLAPVDDSNPANNLGQENTAVGKASSPAHFSFELRNAGPREALFRFQVDSYQLPPPPRCADSAPRESRAALPSPHQSAPTRPPVPAAHDAARHPLPEGWTVDLDPAQPRLQPEAQITVRVTITPPLGHRGRQPVNINAYNEHGSVGGVTLLVDST